jgi:hypothetical protein
MQEILTFVILRGQVNRMYSTVLHMRSITFVNDGDSKVYPQTEEFGLWGQSVASGKRRYDWAGTDAQAL